MSFKAVYSPNSKADIKQAIAYYQKNASKTIAKKFYKEVRESVAHLCKSPYYRGFYNGNRGFVMRVFPYIIFYKVEEDKQLILVKSVFHTSQNPEKRL